MNCSESCQRIQLSKVTTECWKVIFIRKWHKEPYNIWIFLQRQYKAKSYWHVKAPVSSSHGFSDLGLKSSLIGHLTPRNSMSSFLAVEWIISSPIAQIKKDFSSPTTIFVCSCTQTKVFSIFLRYLSSTTWTSYWICSWKRSKIRTINQSFSMHV